MTSERSPTGSDLANIGQITGIASARGRTGDRAPPVI
jgi:hypothetical protein